LVLGEGGGVSTPVYEQVVASQKEAGKLLQLKAGLDVGISYETDICYHDLRMSRGQSKYGK
jgi:hypothetical protein